MVTIEDFKKLDLRVATVKEVGGHPNADKLLLLKIDVGGEEKQLVAGIKGSYQPDELIGKRIIVINNLEPATIRGEESQGMLLAAKDDNGITVLTTDKEVELGSRVS